MGPPRVPSNATVDLMKPARSKTTPLLTPAVVFVVSLSTTTSMWWRVCVLCAVRMRKKDWFIHIPSIPLVPKSALLLLPTYHLRPQLFVVLLSYPLAHKHTPHALRLLPYFDDLRDCIQCSRVNYYFEWIYIFFVLKSHNGVSLQRLLTNKIGKS